MMPETGDPYDALRLLDADALDQIVLALHALSSERDLHSRDPLEQKLQALIDRAGAARERTDESPHVGRRFVVAITADVEVAEVVVSNLDRLEILVDDTGIRHADRLAHFHVTGVEVVG